MIECITICSHILRLLFLNNITMVGTLVINKINMFLCNSQWSLLFIWPFNSFKSIDQIICLAVYCTFRFSQIFGYKLYGILRNFYQLQFYMMVQLKLMVCTLSTIFIPLLEIAHHLVFKLHHNKDSNYLAIQPKRVVASVVGFTISFLWSVRSTL